MQVQDDLYMGPGGGPAAFNLQPSTSDNPTSQPGVGPMGRIAFRNIVPAALSVNNIAALQASTLNTAFTLAAGAGVTRQAAPDGSGNFVYAFDQPRCVSLTNTTNMIAVSYTIVGYDEYGARMSQVLIGPNNTTVNTLKAFASVLSVTPNATNAGTLSVGSSDIFGLPFRITDAGLIISAKWAGVLAQNAGTFVVADTTSPATTATGDVRGTFAQAGAASNGARRLVIAMHLDGTQAGPNATQAAAIGVTQA